MTYIVPDRGGEKPPLLAHTSGAGQTGLPCWVAPFSGMRPMYPFATANRPRHDGLFRCRITGPVVSALGCDVTTLLLNIRTSG